MQVRPRLGLLALTALLSACGGEETTEPSTPTPTVECEVADRVLEDGSCLSPGVDQCAEGFVADGVGGCVAVLPPEPCPYGLMAVPGDEACREVAPCGAAPWGDIPVEPDTQYVDSSFAGTSTGTADAPWTTVQEAIDGAAPGAIVALATGLYSGDLTLTKPLRLWGRCPAEVTLDAPTGMSLTTGSGGSEIHALAISSGTLRVTDADVLIEQVWFHDSSDFALAVTDGSAPGQVTLRDSLVEQATRIGVHVGGSVATIEGCAIRATRPDANNQHGVGVDSGPGQTPAARPTLTVRGCHVSRNVDSGISLFGADATIEATAIRDTSGSMQPASGPAISLQTIAGQRTHLSLTGSTVTRNRAAGILTMGSDAIIEGTTVRWTDSQLSDGLFGRGVLAQYQPTTNEASTLVMRRSLVEANRESGISLLGATGTIEDVIVRDTQPRVLDNADGRGISVQIEPNLGLDAALDLSYSIIERNQEVGIFIGASTVTIHHVIVRDTLPQTSDGLFGGGLMLQEQPDTGARAVVSMATSLVANNYNVGIFVGGSDLTLFDTRVEGTVPRLGDGLMGDGVSALSGIGPTVLDIQESNIGNNSRAGIASFGSTVSVGNTALQCNAFALNGQDNATGPFSFTDGGGNRCGCNDQASDCKVQTTELVPPTPID